MLKFRRTDYLAILVSMLLLPLFFYKESEEQLFQLASNVEVYSDSYSPQVKSPIGFLIQNETGNLPKIPYLVFPAVDYEENEAITDLVRFVNLQKELVYGQRYQTPFVSPYIIQSQQLFTQGKIIDETLFRDAVDYHSVNTKASGRIISFSNQVKDKIAGMTENFEVFLENTTNELMSSDELSGDFTDFITEKSVLSTISPKILLTEDYIAMQVTCLTQNTTYFLTGMLNVFGNKRWFKVGQLPNEKWKFTEDDSIIREVKLEHDGSQSVDAFGKLSACLKQLTTVPKHGQRGFLDTCDAFLYVQQKNIVSLMNYTTGQEEASFLLFPGIVIAKDPQKDTFQIHFISDSGIREATKKGQLNKYKFKFDAISYELIGKDLDTLRLKLKYASVLSENHEYVENAMEVNFDELTPIANPLLQPQQYDFNGNTMILYVAPNGILYQIAGASGQVEWKASIPDFIANTMNAHVSVEQLNVNEKLIFMTLGHRILVFDPRKGYLKYQWNIPETADIFDVSDYQYDDEKARIKVQIETQNIHPFVEKRSLFIIRNGYMDVLELSDASVGLVNFWERLSLLVLTILFLAIILRSFNKEQKHE